MKPILLIPSLTATAVLMAPLAQAATFNWNGPTTSGTWTTAATNWDGASGTPWDSTNGISNIASFAPEVSDAAVEGTVYCNGIIANGTILLGGTGTVRLSGALPTITVNEDQWMFIDRPLTGTTGMRKAGSGTLVLQETSSYTGQSQILEGKLFVAADNGLGSGQLSMASGTQLHILAGHSQALGQITMGGDAMIASSEGEAITLTGGFGNSTGNNTIQSDLILGGIINPFSLGSGALQIDGNLDLNGKNLNCNAHGGIVITGNLTGTGTFITNVINTRVDLSGTSNTFSGAITVNRGTVSMASISDTGGTIYLGTTQADVAAELCYTGTENVSTARPVQIRAKNGGEDRQIRNDGEGNIEFTGSWSFTRSNSPDTPHAVNFVKFSGSSTAITRVSANLADGPGGSAGVILESAGTLILDGQNTFFGPTILNSGTLSLANILSGDPSSNLSHMSPLEFNGGTLQFTGSDGFYDQSITIQPGKNAVIDVTAGTLTLLGAINTPTSGGLKKIGSGILNLIGANTYRGDTIVEGGTLVLANGALLEFAPGASGVCNSLRGTTKAVLDGALVIIFDDVVPGPGASWKIIDVQSLSVSYGPTFSVFGFTKTGNIWSMNDGTQTWFFQPATGMLTLAPPQDVDFDGDGMKDEVEVSLSALGFDWQKEQTELVRSFYARASAAGYFQTPTTTVRAGPPRIERDPATGTCKIKVGWWCTNNGQNFDPVPANQGQVSVNPKGDVEFKFSLPDDGEKLLWAEPK